MHRNASNFGHFTIIMQSQESPSHSIFEATEAEKQMTMEMCPSVAHGSGELATQDLRRSNFNRGKRQMG